MGKKVNCDVCGERVDPIYGSVDIHLPPVKRDPVKTVCLDCVPARFLEWTENIGGANRVTLP